VGFRARREEVEQALEGNVLATAELVGTFERWGLPQRLDPRSIATGDHDHAGALGHRIDVAAVSPSTAASLVGLLQRLMREVGDSMASRSARGDSLVDAFAGHSRAEGRRRFTATIASGRVS
jgi:hypothetical protein